MVKLRRTTRDRRLPLLWSVAVLAWLVAHACAREARDLTVRVSVQSGPSYVGQAIALDVSTISGSQPPRIFPPALRDAEIMLLDPQPRLRQIMSSAIGDVIDERILYTYHFRLVPHRAGAYRIPPFVVRAGGQSGESKPFSVMVRELPALGRPASFLGGVGSLTVDAGVEPGTVRVGQAVEYQIGLHGTAARGSTIQPELEALRRLPTLAQVQSLGTEAVLDPPSRIFRYRLRPTQAGTVTIPPVAVSYFDPGAGRYFTRTTPSVSLRVVDVPRFDPSSLAYGPAEPQAVESRAGPGRFLWFLGLSLAAIGLGSAIIAVLVRKPSPDCRTFARQAARELQKHRDGEAMAVFITSALTGYLSRATGRPEGALTPSEATVAVIELSGNPALGRQAGGIVSLCDRIRYGGHGDSAAGLAEQAAQLFEAFSRLIAPAEHGPEKNQGRPSRPLSASEPVLPPPINLHSKPDTT